MKNERRNMVSKDTIYRQEAIDALETVKPIKAENGELYITKINARMKLEKLPSAQSKQRMRQIGEDTVLFSVPMEDLDATSRVILESGTWCKTFYQDGQAEDATLHESCTDCPLYDNDRHMCPRFNKVIPTTIQEILNTWTQRWIPVTERLPEESGQYLITVKYKHVNGYEDIYTEHGEWSDGGWDMSCFGHCGEVEDIIAWMPLPMPYREEVQE